MPRMKPVGSGVSASCEQPLEGATPVTTSPAPLDPTSRGIHTLARGGGLPKTTCANQRPQGYSRGCRRLAEALQGLLAP